MKRFIAIRQQGEIIEVAINKMGETIMGYTKKIIKEQIKEADIIEPYFIVEVPKDFPSFK